MLLDHYTACYYQARDQLKSLIIVTEFEFHRDVGVLFSKDRKGLADCLTFHRSNIWRLVQTNTATFKVILFYKKILRGWSGTAIYWYNLLHSLH